MAKLAIALIAAALALVTPVYPQDARKLKIGDFVHLYQKVGCTDLSDAIISGTLDRADAVARVAKMNDPERNCMVFPKNASWKIVKKYRPDQFMPPGNSWLCVEQRKDRGTPCLWVFWGRPATALGEPRPRR
jgi:hypothetical protein